MKKNIVLIIFLFLFTLINVTNLQAVTYSDDFSGDLSSWTPGPDHFDNFEIIDGELFMNGYGHLTTNSGWGILQFNETLGNAFTASWQSKLTYYDYMNFVLFADSPWEFTNPGYGKYITGYVFWCDIDDNTNPLMDILKVDHGVASNLPGNTRDIPYSPDIALNEWVNWRVEKKPNSIKIYVNDNLMIDTYDDQFANSNYKIGLSFGEDSEGYVDNFKVTAYDSEIDKNDVDPVPEPSTMLLLGMSTLGMTFFRKRFK